MSRPEERVKPITSFFCSVISGNVMIGSSGAVIHQGPNDRFILLLLNSLFVKFGGKR